MKYDRNRFQFRSLIALLVSTSMGLASMPARAAEVTKFQLRDRSLIANFETADGCFVATTSVRYTESVTQTGGPQVPSPSITLVEVDYSNGCTGEFLTLTGGTDSQTASFGGDVASGSLSAVVPVTDGTNSTTVTINLTWTGNAPLQRAKDHFRSRDGNTITVEKIDFQLRTADVAGTLTTVLPLAAGPTALNLGTDLVSGTIGKDVFGDRTVTKKH